MQSPAIVSYKSDDGKSIKWKLETIKVRDDLQPNEVLIEMSSVGLCGTDIAVAANQTEDVRILGHEGSGTVKKIGSKVTNCSPGDPVLLSFAFCKDCDSCNNGYELYCQQFIPLNTNPSEDEIPDIFQTLAGTWAAGKFFGQSSFSKFSVVNSTLVVNLKDFNLSQEQLDKLGPLGCGIQTGCGAVLNAGGATKGESIVIYGLGGVGMAGVMAAKIAGCYPIIVVDIVQSKIDMAIELGATHGIVGGSDEDAHKRILELTGTGARLSVVCVGGKSFVEKAVNNSGIRGKVVYVGLGRPGEFIEIPSVPFMMTGKQLIACIEGNATPPEFVPKMVNWYLEGKFAIDKIEKEYSIEDFQQALDDIKSGKAIKPILKF